MPRHIAQRKIAPGGLWGAYTSNGLSDRHICLWTIFFLGVRATPSCQIRRGLSQLPDTKQTSDARGSTLLLVMSGHALGLPIA